MSIIAPQTAVPATRPWHGAVLLLARRPAAGVGGGLLALMVGLALVGPLVAPYGPNEVSLPEALQPPSAVHLLGTDALGRDVLSRVLVGGALSLQIGFFAVVLGAAIGVPLGLVAGYQGGNIDGVIMRGVDILMAFPGVLMAITVVAITGPGTTNVTLAVGISLVAIYVRLVRSVVVVLREQLFVEAARAVGASSYRIALRHVLPNALAPILVLSTVAVAWSILIAASLSFLGLGPSPPTPEWGIDLSNGRNYLRAAWWVSTFPGVAIMVTVLGVNLLGDGLREVLDPYLRRAGEV